MILDGFEPPTLHASNAFRAAPALPTELKYQVTGNGVFVLPLNYVVHHLPHWDSNPELFGYSEKTIEIAVCFL